MQSTNTLVLITLISLVVFLELTKGATNQQQYQNQATTIRNNRNPQLATQKLKRNDVRPTPTTGLTNSGKNEKANLETSFHEPDELPADFYEMPAEQLDLGMNATGRAPVPILNVAVLQNGQVIDSAATVHPGTPLEMVIYLDDKSAKVYGLSASYLKVQDDTSKQREEVIVLNGCSIDTYIFGNFKHNPDDQSLRAKFKAFKFPESNFVRFVGTVNVCIKQCTEANCSGGRRKRALIAANGSSKDEKLVMTVSTVLRIADPIAEHKRVR